MPWRVDDIQRQPLDFHLVSVRHAHRNHIDIALLAHHGRAMRAIAERADAGNVIVVKVRIQRLDQIDLEFLHQLQITVHLLEHRIDNQRFPAAAAGQYVE